VMEGRLVALDREQAEAVQAADVVDPAHVERPPWSLGSIQPEDEVLRVGPPRAG
jgi:hypothetical protein